jgi:predicted DCC family thiol-disulfide oxidoreductase YuxK
VSSTVSSPTHMKTEAGKGYPPVLLYDGSCGMCAGIVQFILRADRRGTLRFASLDGGFAQEVLSRHPIAQGIDSMLWIEWGPIGERVLLRSDAAMRICAYLGGPWRVVEYLGRLIPARVRFKAYDLIARRRRRWFGPASACSVPSAEQRNRFIV